MAKPSTVWNLAMAAFRVASRVAVVEPARS